MHTMKSMNNKNLLIGEFKNGISTFDSLQDTKELAIETASKAPNKSLKSDVCCAHAV